MRRALLIAVALSLILVACADPSEPAGYDPTDSAWLLESGTLRGAAIPVLATHPITLVFEEDGAGGTSACNQYFGDYTISGAAIGFDQLTQTDMACSPDQVMDSEARFLEALRWSTLSPSPGIRSRSPATGWSWCSQWARRHDPAALSGRDRRLFRAGHGRA